MNISQAARHSGLSAKTIRYYEQIGLVVPAARADNGYRQYVERDLEELQFLHRARQVGFDLDECRQLLALLRDHARHSVQARELVLEKRRHVKERIRELQAMERQLADMARRCRGDEGPDCAILDDLSGGEHHHG
ncbi:Cu(I)-responsive transcriptional regulator [Parahaliea maris]|uniref:HTH-type transcriptional regulator CueR n=1 Tax=Parahaliea maris TaxID=2716870 RepID=A0A5C9A4Z0_9GAMM|nr:Cu(I)-responsive transcriptional regulator [Parahaliea maris]TXS96003.1 Cu(I)-responsive transcriptional regulator [Parahaliea maris]